MPQRSGIIKSPSPHSSMRQGCRKNGPCRYTHNVSDFRVARSAKSINVPATSDWCTEVQAHVGYRHLTRLKQVLPVRGFGMPCIDSLLALASDFSMAWSARKRILKRSQKGTRPTVRRARFVELRWHQKRDSTHKRMLEDWLREREPMTITSV